MKSFLPKPILLFVIFLFYFSQLNAQNAWINEFHYDNVGGDTDEFVEVVIEDADSYDLNLFTLHLYNGDGGEIYGSSYSLGSFIEEDTENGFTFFYRILPTNGIQNGAPDGFSLDYDGTLIQFISYEGDFNGVGGPADGELSVDIGVEETSSTPIGESLQLSGSGSYYADFTWQAPASETKGQLNNGQALGTSCTSPSTQASFSSPTAGDIGDNEITFNWTSGDGDAVLILAKENSTVDEYPVNGTTYTADNDFSSGLAEEIGTGNFVVYDGSGTSVDLTGLTQGTAYHFAIFEYLTTDQCYLTESETILISTTTSLDEDSKIEAPITQIASSNISSIANSEVDAVPVFEFVIEDQGSGDGVSTLINNIVIEKSTDNDISDWSSFIKGAKLNDGNVDLSITDLSINQDNIVFDLTGNEFEIADGTTESLTLFIWLEESQIDQAVLGFEIPENHGFEANPNGSLLANPISSTITSNPSTIEVEATDFEITTVSSSQVNEAFDLSVIAIDGNGNTDLASRNISISLNTGNGNLSSSSVGLGPLAMTDGFYEWTDLEYDVEESIIIEVSDGNTLTENASEIDIIPLITSVFFSEYIEGNSSNKALEIFNNSGGIIDLNDFSLAIYTNGSESIGFEYELSNAQKNISELPDQETLVISNTSADSLLKAIADTIQFSITNFNGDDALALLYKGNIIDVVGEIGVQPSKGWEVAGVPEATMDKTLVRKARVEEGNPNFLSSFGNNTFDSEWTVYDLDEFSFLGDHFRCESPTEQMTNVSIQNITENTAELNWDAPAGLYSIVLIKEGSPVGTEPVSGISYTANSDFPQADELGNGNRIVFAGNGESVLISNLNDGSTYHIAIYSYADSCYNLDSPATINFTTEIALDQDSEINELAQPDVSSLLSTVDQELEAVDVFSFQISDLATQDSEPTLIERMVFESTNFNSLAWENTVNAILKDEEGKVNNAQFTIINDRIEIEFPEDEEYEIPAGESVDFNIAIWFNRFQVSDTAQFALQIPVEHEFITLNSGSALLNNLTEEIVSNEVGVLEAFDSIEEIRNGETGTKYVTTGHISSHDFGVGNSQFYIQKDESTTYEQGIAVFSDVKHLNLKAGNKVKILGNREEINGAIRLNADTVIISDNEEFIPKTYPISVSAFNSTSELIGTRVEMDSLNLVQPEPWNNLEANILEFSNGEDTVLVKIQPHNIYFDGNAQVPFGAVDLAGVMEKSNDSIQLFVTLDNEISDSYAPVFKTEPSISNIAGESINLMFAVNELSTVYYAVKNTGDSIPDLQTLKNPQSDAQIISSGIEKIKIGNINDSIQVNIQGLTSNAEYSVYLVTEDTLGNANEIFQLDFYTLNEDADEDVSIIEPNVQIAQTKINAFEASQDFVAVFNFSVKDGGTNDELSTFISQMVIHSSSENEVKFNELLADVELFDLSNDSVMGTKTSMLSDSIVLELDKNFELSDGDSNAFQVRIKLKKTVEDEQKLAFQIPANNSSWEVEPNGSQLANDFGKAVTSSIHSLDVIATEFEVKAPAEVYVNEDFNISLSAQDQNGNIDYADRTLNILDENDSSFFGQSELNLSKGAGIFENLSYMQSGIFSFEITDGSISEVIQINFIKPALEVDTAGFIFDFGLINYPEVSKIQSYQLSAEKLKDSIIVVAPERFQLSLNSDFTAVTDTLAFDHENFNEIEIFVRFSPNDGKGAFYQGNIVHFSRGADTLNLAVSGQEGTLNLATIESVRHKPLGERVKIQGVVVGGNNHFVDRRIIQDETAGIAIEGLNSISLNFGDSVEVEGVISEIENWLTVIPESEVNILSIDSVLAEPLLISIADINQNLESQRVRIENLSIIEEGLFEIGEYLIYDDSDTITLKLNSEDHPLVGMEIPFEKLNVTGFIGRNKDIFYVFPELTQDLEIIPRDTVLNIEAPKEGLSFGNVLMDYNSEPKTYSLQAENISENLKISASENFEISLLEDAHYGNDLILPINERGDIPEVNIYVRFSPIAARGGAINGEIFHKTGSQIFLLPLNGFEEVITANNHVLKGEILIYPNPVNSHLSIKTRGSNEYHYQLLGLDGSIFMAGELKNDQTLNLASLDNGIYFLKIIKGTENYVHRIIKK
jgi:hypothetical protein